jgi:FtsP/CotA-like multicopper oxidase with cupredoxin domain
VTITGFDALWAYGTTDRMVVETRKGQSWCIQVVTMDSTHKLTPEREPCGTGAMKYPVLSPDGKTLVVPELKKAIISGRRHGDQPHGYTRPAQPDRQRLRRCKPHPQPGLRRYTSRCRDTGTKTTLRPLVEQLLVRCDVVTGNREKLVEKPATKDGKTITLGKA